MLAVKSNTRFANKDTLTSEKKKPNATMEDIQSEMRGGFKLQKGFKMFGDHGGNVIQKASKGAAGRACSILDADDGSGGDEEFAEDEEGEEEEA
jgi:hypothetical protein